MQAIRTKYYGPTNTTGSCIRAKCEAGSIRMPYRHEMNYEGNHIAACELLLKKLGWNTSHYSYMRGGQFGNDYYWVFVEGSPATALPEQV